MARCKSYVGVACVDGSCPIANAEEREERCMEVIRKCKDCWMYKGCEDCALEGTEYCEKVNEMSELKRCPFCGGEAGLLKGQCEIDNYVMCLECRSKTKLYNTKASAIKAWNTRKPMQNIVERLGNKHNESTINYHNLKDASCLGERHAYRNAIEIVKEEGGMHE